MKIIENYSIEFADVPAISKKRPYMRVIYGKLYCFPFEIAVKMVKPGHMASSKESIKT